METTTTTITRWLEMIRPRLVQIISQDLAGHWSGFVPVFHLMYKLLLYSITYLVLLVYYYSTPVIKVLHQGTTGCAGLGVYFPVVGGVWWCLGGGGGSSP